MVKMLTYSMCLITVNELFLVADIDDLTNNLKIND